MTTEVIIDFETASACALERCGADVYARDPTTEILCLVFQVGDSTPLVWTPHRHHEHATAILLSLVSDPAVIFKAHNAGFEKAIWRHIMVPDLHWPAIPNSRWRDTMAVCAMKMLPMKLGNVARVLRLPTQKDKEGSRFTVGLSSPREDGSLDRRPSSLEIVYRYCVRDIETEVMLDQAISNLPQGELDVWMLDQRINERGVRLDRKFIKAAQEVVTKAIGPLAGEFRSLTQGLEFTQIQKLRGWVSERGASLPDLRADTVDWVLGLDEDSLDEPPELPPDVRRALEIRRLIGSASVKKLWAMDACLGPDDRARGVLQYHGAGTGRWSGRLFQPQNFPREQVLVMGEHHKLEPMQPQRLVDAIMSGDPEYVSMVSGEEPVETVVKALRHAIAAPPGRLLAAGDYAGIEMRIVLALAGQLDLVEMLAKGQSPYIAAAEGIYHRPIDKKIDIQEYTIGKNIVLGGGFQMGAAKARARYGPNETLEFWQGVVRTYREETAPAVPKLWEGLQKAAHRAVYSGGVHEAYGVVYQMELPWLTACLPSGRKLWYFQPEKTRRPMPWDADDIRDGWAYTAQKNGQSRLIHAFGGLLTENVVQGLARDLLVDAMFKCEKNGLPVVMTVHDEIVIEPDHDAADELKQIMEDIPEWARTMRVPVSAETWSGARYHK